MVKLYYKDDNVAIIHGDCIEAMSKLKKPFDACITDPPYGTTACRWDNVIPFEPMWDAIYACTKDDGAICLFGSEPFSSLLRCSNLKYFKYDWIWDKQCGMGYLDSKFRPLKCHEIISVFSKAGCSNGSKPPMIYNPQGLIPTTKQNRHTTSSLLHSQPRDKEFKTTHTNYPKSILQYKRVSGLHPTQKPVELIEYLIKTYTNEGERVLDFTCGSGTTLIAGLNTGRKVVGIEMDEKYCEVAKQRVLQWYEEHK